MEPEFPYSFFLFLFMCMAFATFFYWAFYLRKRPPEYFTLRYSSDTFGDVVPSGPLTKAEFEQIHIDKNVKLLKDRIAQSENAFCDVCGPAQLQNGKNHVEINNS